MPQMLAHPFAPLIFNDTEVLILGSFPSAKSFEKSFYYAHPSNQFWKILSAITTYPARTRDQRIWLLKQSKIGLWDMIAACRQENSLDSTLYDEELNDIVSFLDKHKSIKRIAFTGRKAQTLFERDFASLKIERSYLPSPSSAYAKMNIEEKIDIYKKELFDRRRNS